MNTLNAGYGPEICMTDGDDDDNDKEN